MLAELFNFRKKYSILALYWWHWVVPRERAGKMAIWLMSCFAMLCSVNIPLNAGAVRNYCAGLEDRAGMYAAAKADTHVPTDQCR